MPKAPSLKEIRDAYSDYSSELKDIQEEGRTDMRYVSGDPWEPEDRAQREEAGRPCLSPDEISQYLNQTINNVWQNERAIEITPTGNGANDKTAARRQSMIQGIEYRSNAQDAYMTAFTNMINRSYGFARITSQFVPGSMNQEIRIKPIPNPDMVIYNPNFRCSDGSDIEDLFVADFMSKKAFKRKYGKIRPESFSTDEMIEAPGWIRENYVVTAEYWKVHQVLRKLLMINGPNGVQEVYEDELKEKIGSRDKRGKFISPRNQVEVIREREEETPKVVQYITNGVEYLDEVEWWGSRIPIAACFGKQLFVNKGSGAKRILLSMVRLARDPQMMMAYYASQEAEEAGMTPKSAFIGAKGQFDSNPEVWETIHRVGRGYIEYDPIVDGGTNTILPPPSRPQFIPNFQAYELAKESTRRSVQASMGIAALPTAAQRSNEKSGLAIDKIQSMEAVGALHFTKNYEQFLQNVGFQVNEGIAIIYDTQREVPTRKADGTPATMHTVGNESHPIGDDGVYDVQGLPDEHLHTGQGDHEATVSAGPSFQSQREAQADFVDMLIKEMANLPIPPPIGAKILAKAIRMKSDLGIIAEEIADLLDPPDPNNIPPQAQAMVAQLQAQIQQLTQENSALHLERAGKVLEQQTKVQIEGMRGKTTLDAKNIEFITKVVVAQLASKSRSTDQIAEQDAERELTMLGMAHDSAHQLASQVVAHHQQMQQAAQQHKQASDLATQQGAQALVQQQQAAENQPTQ